MRRLKLNRSSFSSLMSKGDKKMMHGKKKPMKKKPIKKGKKKGY
jgi:hypothetical protein